MALEKNIKKISPFRLSSLLRLQKNPLLALQLFQTPNPNTPTKPFRYSLLSYDIIITKLGKAKMFTEMEQILTQMTQETRFSPKEIIFCNVITYYGHAHLPHKAIHIFNNIPSHVKTMKSLNTLLNTLLICKEYAKINEIFVSLEQYDVKDVCSYNILMHAWCLRGEIDHAWKLFDEMPKRGMKPNAVTFAILINTLCVNGKLREGMSMKHDMMKKYNVKPNVYVYTSLIKGFCKEKELDEAFKLKEEMVSGGLGVESKVYNTLITGLFRSGRKGEVFGLLEEMKCKGCKPDTATYNAMISGFVGEKEFESAFGMLKEMKEKGCKPDVISYNVIIAGLCKDGKVREAMDLFEDMPRRDCVPDVVTYRTLFGGLCDECEFDEAELILDEMLFKGHVPHVASVNKFVSGLRQEGKLKMLESVLSSLAKRDVLDLDTWMMAITNVCVGDSRSKTFGCLDTLTMPEETN